MTDKININKLTDFEVVEVSLVDAGANLKKRFPITKDVSMEFSEILKSVLETEMDNEDKVVDICKVKGVSEKGLNAARAVHRILNGFADELPVDVLKAMPPWLKPGKGDAADEEDEEEVAAKKKKAQADKCNWMDGKTGEDMEEEKTKKVKKEFENIMKAQKDELEVVRKELMQVKDERALEIWTKRAEQELSHYPGKSAQELGVIFKSFMKISPELCEEQFGIYKAASDALKNSDILKTRGLNQSGEMGANAYAVIEKKSELLAIEKGMTKEQAMAKVLQDNPDLYAQYLAEGSN